MAQVSKPLWGGIWCLFIDQYTVMGLARVFLTDITVKLGETLGKSGTTRVYPIATHILRSLIGQRNIAKLWLGYKSIGGVHIPHLIPSPEP